jgi:hypothetical protein
MPESPREMAARADRVLAKCRDRGTTTLADLENLKHIVRDLADEYESMLEAAVELKAVVDGLNDEFGILDHGGGVREATPEPIPLRVWNAALCVDHRSKGTFAPGGRRPATLMRRKATAWTEIPADVTPGDIFPGYVEQQTAAEPKETV